jgi:hypothetical protein
MTTGRLTGLRQPILTKPFAFEKLEETLVSLIRGSGVLASAAWM